MQLLGIDLGPWLGFVGVMALGQFSPGPDLVLITRTSLSAGAAAGCRMAAGIAVGLALHAALAVGGVAMVLAESAWASRVMAFLAAGYLLLLGWRLLKSQGVEAAQAGGVAAGSSAFRQGLTCNLLNPKVAIFLAAVTAPFLSTKFLPPQLLWATIVIEGFLLWLAWVFALQARPLREAYFRRAKWIDRTFGTALWILAVTLLGSAMGKG